MPRKKILYIVHNHPSVRPGGAETYALELYEAMRDSAEFEPYLLAKSGPPISKARQFHSGTLLGHVNSDPNQYFLYTPNEFDWFNGVLKPKEILTRFFREFLEATQPDIVHFQHTLFFGYDIIRVVRDTLPNCAIVYTLHEFLPICHRQGQMLRTVENSNCMQATPLRCNTCFPQHSPQDFFMRKKLVQSHFSLVDLFIAPSRFLLERYVDWGIPRDRILFEEYGRLPMTPYHHADIPRARNRFAFFGQISPFKGVDVLLEAMRILVQRECEARESFQDPLPATGENPRPQLRIYGANLDLQEALFQARVRTLLEQTRQHTTLVGRYDQSQLASLMADVDWVIVPSIWWENSPLVIQEAFGHGRPVICSNIGGMAEKVHDGHDGLHFRVADALSLADTIERAATTPALWDNLASNIRGPYSMEEHTRVMEGLYHRVLTQHSVCLPL
jgi:glycosyltransferase involved in cell wall biosynthesis